VSAAIEVKQSWVNISKNERIARSKQVTPEVTSTALKKKALAADAISA